MNVNDTSKQLKLLQEELACLRAAEEHIQDKINILLNALNNELIAPDENHEHHDLGDLPALLQRFETQHPALTDSINRVMVTLSNMGI